MRTTARPNKTAWAGFVLLVVVTATVITTAAPSRADFIACPSADVTVGQSAVITLEIDSEDTSFLRINGSSGGTAIAFLDEEHHIGAGTWFVRVQITADETSLSGSHTIVERSQQGPAIDTYVVQVTVDTTTTTTEPPPTTTTTTTKPPVTTTQPLPPTTTTTTTEPTTTTTTAAVVGTTEPPDLATTTTTRQPTRTTTSGTAGAVADIGAEQTPPGAIVAAPPIEPVGTPGWLIITLMGIIGLGIATVAITLVPGATAAVTAKMGAVIGDDDASPSLRHRLATSWLGVLLWDRSRRVKGPSLASRVRESEFAQSWRTRQEVRKARRRIDHRRRDG